jgi:rare lipoprotein A (peptidoglycan hydrolase)
MLVAIGVASWFQPASMYDRRLVCAMRDPLLIGRRVFVLNMDNGRRSSCFVVGLGPFVRGRVIDVSPSVRDQLRMHGIASVRVTLRP